MIKPECQSIAADDGYSIPIVSWRAGATVRAVVLIAHGMGEYALRYQWLAERLVSGGAVVYGHDHRGHGANAARAGCLGDFGRGGFAALVDDLAVVARLAGHEYPGRPLFVLGHSMGSYVAQAYAFEHGDSLAGLALSGCAALDARLAALGEGGWTAAEPNRAFEPARTPWDWLSRDDDAVDGFVADPLCGFRLNDAAQASIAEFGPRLADPTVLATRRPTLPVLMLSGDRDPVNGFLAHFELLASRLRDAGMRDLSTFVYGGARHDLFHETNRGEVATNIRAWIDRVLLS